VHFRRDGDRIDLTALTEDFAVRFVGTGPFTGVGLVMELQVGAGVVRLDMNRDRVADLVIRIEGGLTLDRADFLL
jgi:hypothetical protein